MLKWKGNVYNLFETNRILRNTRVAQKDFERTKVANDPALVER
ncbi:hypothetical protein SAMN02746068_01436 [Lactococcus chungangensis CAU 28 = DSM 22330]|jgi:hypothetical protein|uniref:Uncharacterized protein n=1 Tax=Pseudolactococcus chungangensis CAU 28 = DSM 22330 TaxID=1122154 RepID=A0A1K2HE22_9LACT|nr:hypothetical protein SAMN02746068_01436 [Lactococcus chungangensis CAU 28 = DSM 22330]